MTEFRFRPSEINVLSVIATHRQMPRAALMRHIRYLSAPAQSVARAILGDKANKGARQAAADFTQWADSL